MENYINIRTFDELVEFEHRKIGTESRNKYEEGAQMFIISEMLKAAHKEAKLTQEQLAKRQEPRRVTFLSLKMGKGIFNSQH